VRPARAAFDGPAALSAWGELVETPAPRRGGDANGDDFVLLLDENDEAHPDLLETLSRAQAASGADVVTCAVRVPAESGERLHFFHGDPGALGLLFNGYGTTALVRRSLLPEQRAAEWPLLAQLTLAGARIVSVPLPLVTREAPPASLERAPEEALLVATEFERELPEAARGLARLAVGLAAAPPARPAPAAKTGTRRTPRRAAILRRRRE
jgi:hypothetical protein